MQIADVNTISNNFEFFPRAYRGRTFGGTVLVEGLDDFGWPVEVFQLLDVFFVEPEISIRIPLSPFDLELELKD